MSDRLAAWAGPTNSPIAVPAAKNHVRSGATTARPDPRINPTSETTIVNFEPSQSSTHAKAKAPSPAATFSKIPNVVSSAIDMPKVPAA